ncbi:MAG: saccharopine dehydrogenase NADP-binding domain-containing protein [Clostridium sp.]|uniref:saccharopine dehydrogenase NADP-binding domain-containing protein n=1 Tax=Clostridium sp. DSM 8431 TaxID=1761781 RepID=UPI0008EAA625|nr:saccharopine dehydrogenase NADP-binding domain-containing protein [Clostridium sp. DSM 8431]MCR4944513.1 saccharopine dehydrogenase NADP-binding domain-containing protein [Clostridium sp.]SFU41381.1 Saccharopine dehydrogenase NADP binding domain-containing protein [Clostridium sp. DSM 8431]
MNKFIGILGYRGSVGECVLNCLKDKYPIKCGQRSEVVKRENGIKYVKLDILNRSELELFCEDCNVVVNCAGPSYYLSKEIAEVTKEKNIGYVDIFGVDILQTLKESKNNTMILGAGSLPGLSGMLLAWIKNKMDDHSIEKMNVYAGGNEEVTTAACVDYLLSIFKGFGKSNVYYYDGEVRKETRKAIRLPEVFPRNARGFEYLTEEMILSASKNKVKELHWHNVQIQNSYKNIMNEAFLQVLKNPEKENIFHVARNVKDKILKDTESTDKWYKIWIEVIKGKTIESYGFKCDNSSLINGKVASICAEKLYNCNSDSGIYWPFEVLDSKKVLEDLISEGILNIIHNDKDLIFQYNLDYEVGEI